MERGEINGYPSVFYNSLVATKPTWLPEKQGQAAGADGRARRRRKSPDVPFLSDLITKEEDKALVAAAVAPLAPAGLI